MAALTRRQKMDELTGRIMRHIATNPEDFAEREPMWMKRERLRRRAS